MTDNGKDWLLASGLVFAMCVVGMIFVWLMYTHPAFLIALMILGALVFMTWIFKEILSIERTHQHSMALLDDYKKGLAKWLGKNTNE